MDTTVNMQPDNDVPVAPPPEESQQADGPVISDLQLPVHPDFPQTERDACATYAQAGSTVMFYVNEQTFRNAGYFFARGLEDKKPWQIPASEEAVVDLLHFIKLGAGQESKFYHEPLSSLDQAWSLHSFIEEYGLNTCYKSLFKSMISFGGDWANNTPDNGSEESISKAYLLAVMADAYKSAPLWEKVLKKRIFKLAPQMLPEKLHGVLFPLYGHRVTRVIAIQLALHGLLGTVPSNKHVGYDNEGPYLYWNEVKNDHREVVKYHVHW